MEPESQKMNRLLSIDGGGIRGFVAIEVLKRLEEKLADTYDPTGTGEFRLCQYFNFIGGTSVGSILATMLCLGWSMDEVEKKFNEVAKKIFKKASTASRVQWSYTDQELAKYLQELFVTESGDPILLGGPELKSLLLVVSLNASTGSPWIITNNPEAKYSQADRSNCNLGFPLWKVIRASTAAPMFFPPERIVTSVSREGVPNVKEFLDGGITSLNNPSFQMFLNATISKFHLEMDHESDKMAIVSVGTGHSTSHYPAGGVSELHAIEFAKLAVESLMDASGVYQDILCRERGDYMNDPAEKIDSEIGNLKDAGRSDFSYHRFDPPLSRFVALDNISEIKFLQQQASEYIGAVNLDTLPGGALWKDDSAKRILRSGEVLELKRYHGTEDGGRTYPEVTKITPIENPKKFKQPQAWRLWGSLGVSAIFAALLITIERRFGIDMATLQASIKGLEPSDWASPLGKGISFLLLFNLAGIFSALLFRLKSIAPKAKAILAIVSLILLGCAVSAALGFFNLEDTEGRKEVLTILTGVFTLGSLVATIFLIRWRRWLSGIVLVCMGLMLGFAFSFFLALGFSKAISLPILFFAISVAGVHLMWFGRADLRYLHLKKLRKST